MSCRSAGRRFSLMSGSCWMICVHSSCSGDSATRRASAESSACVWCVARRSRHTEPLSDCRAEKWPSSPSAHLDIDVGRQVQQVDRLLLHHAVPLILQDDARGVVAEQELLELDARHRPGQWGAPTNRWCCCRWCCCRWWSCCCGSTWKQGFGAGAAGEEAHGARRYRRDKMASLIQQVKNIKGACFPIPRIGLRRRATSRAQRAPGPASGCLAKDTGRSLACGAQPQRAGEASEGWGRHAVWLPRSSNRRQHSQCTTSWQCTQVVSELVTCARAPVRAPPVRSHRGHGGHRDAAPGQPAAGPGAGREALPGSGEAQQVAGGAPCHRAPRQRSQVQSPFAMTVVRGRARASPPAGVRGQEHAGRVAAEPEPQRDIRAQRKGLVQRVAHCGAGRQLAGEARGCRDGSRRVVGHTHTHPQAWSCAPASTRLSAQMLEVLHTHGRGGTRKPLPGEPPPHAARTKDKRETPLMLACAANHLTAMQYLLGVSELRALGALGREGEGGRGAARWGTTPRVRWCSTPRVCAGGRQHARGGQVRQHHCALRRAQGTGEAPLHHPGSHAPPPPPWRR